MEDDGAKEPDSDPGKGPLPDPGGPPPSPQGPATGIVPVPVPEPPWGALPLPGQGSLAESEDRTWGMLCHLAAFAGLLLPTLGNILGPLVVWLIKKDASPFVDAHGKESLNFQISMSLYLLLGGMVSTVAFFALALLPCFGVIGVVILGLALSALAIFALVYQVIAAIRANEGGFLYYPLTIRFFR